MSRWFLALCPLRLMPVLGPNGAGDLARFSLVSCREQCARPGKEREERLDVPVFTGAAENSAPIRRRAAAGPGFPGVQVDPGRNARAHPGCDISPVGAPVRTLVIQARGGLQIAAETQRALARRAEGPARGDHGPLPVPPRRGGLTVTRGLEADAEQRT